VRALFVTAGFLAIAGVAAAATPYPRTIVRSSSPVVAVTQDAGRLAWLSANQTKCNAVHWTGGKTYVLPQPQSGSLTCRWSLAVGAQGLAIAAGASAALWTLHKPGSDYVITAHVGGKEVKVERLAHQEDGTGWWLGGIAGGGTALAYSRVNIGYINPLSCGSGGSCAEKIAGGGIKLVTAGQKTSLPHSTPALSLAVSDGRIAYIRATAVSRAGAPVTRAGVPVQVVDVPNGALVSQVNPVGAPLAIALSSHVLAVLSRASGTLRLAWYDPATGAMHGALTVSPKTAPALAVDDQVIVYRVGQFLRALTVATGRVYVLAQVTTGFVGFSLDRGRLVWAEHTRTSGRIRALSVG
jgi:hypothetical protein